MTFLDTESFKAFEKEFNAFLELFRVEFSKFVCNLFNCLEEEISKND